MDPRYLGRLQEEQRKAISETSAKIDQIKQFKDDYKAIQDRLKTLPDKMTYDVMVPFGKMAFMPGQLVHTNEILVLLGDNWFVERSAKQAVDIAGRRVNELDKRLKDLEAQQKLLEPRLGFTSDLQAELQGQGDIKEIVEDYEESKEKLWDEQHRQHVKKYQQELRKNQESQSHQNNEEQDEQKTDSSLWSRLDELERQETERGEMDSMSNEDDEENERFHSKVGPYKSSPADRRVSWADETKDEKNSIENSDDDSDDDYTEEDEADNEDDNDETDVRRQLVEKIITFKHSSNPDLLPHQVHEGEDSVIHCPGDIYTLFCPKSILKKTFDAGGNSDCQGISEFNPSRLQNKWSSDTVLEGRSQVSYSDMENEGQSWHQSGSQQFPSSLSKSSQAFTGLVVEKSPDLPTTAAAFVSETPISSVNMIVPRAASVNTSDEPAKRVSKFKASRLSNENP